MSRNKPKRKPPPSKTGKTTAGGSSQAPVSGHAADSDPSGGSDRSGDGLGRSGAGSDDRKDAAHDYANLPNTKTRTWLSVWVSLHLLAIFISFTSVVEPSSIHASLSNLFYPYLRPVHFAADDRPVYLAHGDTYEQPHVIQVTVNPVRDLAAAEAERGWRTVGPERYPGLAVSDRLARWLSTAAMLADGEEPGMVAELLVPIALKEPDIRAIRILRLPTDLNLVNATPETSYLARVTRAGERVALIQLKESRLSSRAISSDRGDAP